MESVALTHATPEFRGYVAIIQPEVDEILKHSDEAAIAPHTDSLRRKLKDIPHYLHTKLLEAAAGDPDRKERLGLIFEPVP